MMSIIIPCKNERDIAQMMIETEKVFPEAQIIVSSDRDGKGKGWALRQGLGYADGDVICFIDGDLDIHPKEINKLLPYLETNDVVVGSKTLSGLWSRRIITLGSRLFIGLLFGLWFDTQTGVKLFKFSAMPFWRNDSFAFDIEMLYMAKRSGARIKSVPVEVSIRKKMPTRSIFQFILGAFQIRKGLCATYAH